MLKNTFAAVCAVSLLTSALAAAPALPYQTGEISILNGRATIQADEHVRYLDEAAAYTVLIDMWGNPPESAEGVAGLLVPGYAEPYTEEGWVVVITESDDGHVSDDDAASTDYDKLMRDMQRSDEEDNEMRAEMGYEPVYTLGWAAPPSYDPTSHKMIWARQLAFGSKTLPLSEQTLNYDVRVLGRTTTLELSAVASMEQLPEVQKNMDAILSRVSYTAGNRYEDYVAGDKTAAYGIAGLVAGGVAAKKLGFLGLLLAFAKKGWVLILAALAAVGRFFKRS